MKDQHDKATADIFEMSNTRYDNLSCLDAAYERKAIDDGMNKNPVFPENIEYLKRKVAQKCIN